MDDIYGDLENYNDVNALDELKNENTKLKFRIEEYASDMQKLQNEFDKVSSKFKILETNYSSLLKTAKAEILRKTQTICNLNSEKDMMVLNAIKNSNKSILNIRRNLLRDKTHNYNLRMMKKDKELDCSKTNRKDLRDSKKFNFDKERKNEMRIPSVDTMTSMSTDECVENKLGKSETYERNSDTKENITKAKSRAQSIRNRRKSMPILGKQLPKFSSDEENDDNSANESKKKDRYSREERNYTEKVKHKISETSGIDEKYSSYHESSRETYYKGKSSRQSDKYRSMRDKYEQSQREKRQFSPERSNRKAPRDHSAEYYRERDYRRHRVLESPPLDRLEVQKRNRRFNHGRENQLKDKHCSRSEKHSVPMKHKLHSYYEEPASKRIRTHSSTRSVEDERKQTKHLTENAIPFRMTDPLVQTSCLSPDYIDPETVTPVKEIVSTTDSKLPDPRLESQKYVLQNENDKGLLCSVTSLNFELKRIDSSTWDIKRVEVPEALTHPVQHTDDLVQQLYQDLDKPISYSMTPESGEIHSDDENVVTDSYFNDIYEEERQRVKDLNIRDFYEKETNDVDIGESHGVSISNAGNANRIRDDSRQLDMPLTEYIIDNAKQENKSDTKITFKLLSKKETESSIKEKDSEYKHREPIQHSGEKKILSCREMVEGDLALSDENSDNIDAQIKDVHKCKPKSQHVKLEYKSSKNNTALSVQDKNSKDKVTSSINQEEYAEEKTAKRTKKTKSTKKSHKSKDKSADFMNTEKVVVEHIDKQRKSEKETKKTGQIKEKFTDLFGDSCSLITPEDLGISAMPVNKYDPLFEDALDANDINVEYIAQPPKETEKKSAEPSEMKDEVSQTAKTKNKKKKSKTNDENRSSIETQEKERDLCSHTINCQAVTKEQDVLSTVIIATGIQPRVSLEESIEPLVDKLADTNVTNEPEMVQDEVLSKLQQMQPTALATSTPCKELLVKNILAESYLGMVESSPVNSNDSTMPRNEASPSDLCSNISSQNMETDAPDMRIIFVKRRKRVLKKMA